jgi:hypothetical protein
VALVVVMTGPKTGMVVAVVETVPHGGGLFSHFYHHHLEGWWQSAWSKEDPTHGHWRHGGHHHDALIGDAILRDSSGVPEPQYPQSKSFYWDAILRVALNNNHCEFYNY